jgi:DNA polymerase-3 subunit chi
VTSLSTRIVFVETTSAEKRVTLCQWVEKFHEDHRKVLVVTDSTPAAQHLDQLLWTFSQESFIPHRIVARDAADPILEPVAIAASQLALLQFDVLIADSTLDLDFMLQFPTVLHFILTDDAEQRQASRLLWQAAKERGLELRHVPYQTVGRDAGTRG